MNWRALLVGHWVTVPAQDLVIERLCLCLGLGPKNPLKRRHAELILAEGRASPSGLDVELHQGPVDGLLERIEPQQPQCGLNGGIVRSGGPLVGQKPRQRAESDLA